MAFGVSFVPGGDASGNQTKPPTEPLQQAIQMLSLRLPKVVGAQGLAPGPLLQSPGGGALAELLRQLFGQGRPGGTMAPSMPGASPMAPGAPSLPPPHVVPGGGDDRRMGPSEPGWPDVGTPPPPQTDDWPARTDPRTQGPIMPPPDGSGGARPSGPYQASVRNPWAAFNPPAGGPGRFFA